MDQNPDAIDLLLERDASGRWPHRVEIRGREYTLDLGGPATFYADRAVFRMAPEGGTFRDITVRPSYAVRVLSRVGCWAPEVEVEEPAR